MFDFYEQSLGAQMNLLVAIDDSQTTFTVLTNQGEKWTTITADRGSVGVIALDDSLPSIIAGEHVHITQRGDGAGGGNQDEFTFTRALFGAARAHVKGEYIFGGFSPSHFYQMHEWMRRMESMLSIQVGANKDSVLVTDDGLQLKVTEGTSDMDVDVAAGHGWINGQLFKLGSAATLTVSAAPGAGTTRIDNINMDIDTMTAVYQEGVEDAGAPTPPAGQVALAEITLDENTVDITETEITDKRIPAG